MLHMDAGTEINKKKSHAFNKHWRIYSPCYKKYTVILDYRTISNPKT